MEMSPTGRHLCGAVCSATGVCMRREAPLYGPAWCAGMISSMTVVHPPGESQAKACGCMFPTAGKVRPPLLPPSSSTTTSATSRPQPGLPTSPVTFLETPWPGAGRRWVRSELAGSTRRVRGADRGCYCGSGHPAAGTTAV